MEILEVINIVDCLCFLYSNCLLFLLGLHLSINKLEFLVGFLMYLFLHFSNLLLLNLLLDIVHHLSIILILFVFLLHFYLLLVNLLLNLGYPHGHVLELSKWLNPIDHYLLLYWFL